MAVPHVGEIPLGDMFEDNIIQLVMRSDKVDPHDLGRSLEDLGRSLREARLRLNAAGISPLQ